VFSIISLNFEVLSVCFRWRSGRHSHDLQRSGDWSLGPTGAPIALDGAQGLLERPGNMDLVKHDHRIMCNESGMDRKRPIAESVTTKQQARTQLIDCRQADRRLTWRSRPAQITKYATPHFRHMEREFVVSKTSQESSNARQDSVAGLLQLLREYYRSTFCLIDDNPTFNAEEDAARCVAFGRQLQGVQRKREYGYLDDRGFASSRRQFDYVRPATVLNYLCRKPRLPRERLHAVDCLEVATEVARL
jgi:hypothetical protein